MRSPKGAAPWGEENVVLILNILDVILMHIFDVILMHILDVLIRMHVLDVLLLLLATTVIAPLLWALHRCNTGAGHEYGVYIYVYTLIYICICWLFVVLFVRHDDFIVLHAALCQRCVA